MADSSGDGFMAKIKQFLVNDLLIKGIIITVLGGAFGAAITAYLTENINVFRTSHLISSATEKINSEKPEKIKDGINTLVQIAIDVPYRKQEMVDIITKEYFRKQFNWQENLPVTPPEKVEVFVASLNAILNIPRENENHHRLNIDLHKIALVSENGKKIYLQNMDFSDVVLWGSEFVNIDFSRSNFENADLGGVRFDNCGLEDLNLKNAKMSFSPFEDTQRPTMFIDSQAARSTIDEALIITGTVPQLVITNTEIDPERREKLKHKAPMVKFEQKITTHQISV